MNASGKVSFGNLILIAGIAAAVYFGVLLFPVMLDHFDVKEEVHKAVNRAYQLDDRAMQLVLAQGLGRIGTHFRPNTYGELEELPGLGLEPEEILIYRDTVSQTIRVEVNYERQVRLKPTQNLFSVGMSAEREGATTR